MSDNAYGDYEPEDAWHPDDDTPTLLANMRKRLALLGVVPIGYTPQEGSELDRIAADLGYWQRRRGTLDTRAMIRVDDLADDVAYMRGRGA